MKIKCVFMSMILFIFAFMQIPMFATSNGVPADGPQNVKEPKQKNYHILLPEYETNKDRLAGIGAAVTVDNGTAVARVTLSQLTTMYSEEIPFQVISKKAYNGRAPDNFVMNLESDDTGLVTKRYTTGAAIIVEQNLAYALGDSLDIYAQQVTANYGIPVEVHSGRWQTPEELKAFIANLHATKGTNGFMLVGTLPYAVWEFAWGETCPLPLFFEDLDGSFQDTDGDGYYDYHVWGDNDGPECWVSYMQAPQNDPTWMKNYLGKVSKYYNGQLDVPNKAFVCVAKDWSEGTGPVVNSLSKMYRTIDEIGGPGQYINGQDYHDQLADGYKITSLYTHSDSSTHRFDLNPLYHYESWRLLEVGEGSWFTILFACKSLNFQNSDSENFGIGYTMGAPKGLAVMGPVRSIGTEWQEILLDQLAENMVLADAYFTWLDYVYDYDRLEARFPGEINTFIWDFALFGNPFIFNGPVPQTTDSIAITAPYCGEHLAHGSDYTLSWSTTGTIENVKIEFSANNGTDWVTLTESTPNDGEFSCPVPVLNSNECLIRISDSADNVPSVTSALPFCIVETKPELYPSQFVYMFNGNAGDTTLPTQYFDVQNTGGGILPWAIRTEVAWLTCSPSYGFNNQTVQMNVDVTGMQPGKYNTMVTMYSPFSMTHRWQLMVTLNIGESGEVTVTAN